MLQLNQKEASSLLHNCPNVFAEKAFFSCGFFFQEKEYLQPLNVLLKITGKKKRRKMKKNANVRFNYFNIFRLDRFAQLIAKMIKTNVISHHLNPF